MLMPIVLLYNIFVYMFTGKKEEELHSSTVTFVTISMSVIIGLFIQFIFERLTGITINDFVVAVCCYTFGAAMTPTEEETAYGDATPPRD
jgi:hypothetical protein